MSIDICNGPVPTGLPACDPGYNTEMGTILIKDIHDRFGVDLKSREQEFREAAAIGKLSFITYPETKWVEINGRLMQYNTVLECNGRMSYYFWIELKRGPSKARLKKKK